MLVRHLFYFVTLVKEKHFARAAEVCCISQPTLSAAIRKLEEDLEIRLVDRGHRYLGLTPEGRKVLEWANQILADYDSLRSDLMGLRQGLSGILRIGVVPAAMPSVALLTTPFCAVHPAATVEIQSLTSTAIQRGLDAFEIDAGITYLENEPILNVRRVPLYHERYVLLTSDVRKYVGRRTITWAEAVEEKLCLLSEDMQNRRIINNVALSMGLTLRPTIVSNSFLSVCSHVRHGGWAGIVPHTFLHLFGALADVLAIDLVEPTHSQAIGLVLSKREPLSPMASAFLASAVDTDFKNDAGHRDIATPE
ncbi:LysR family transcriptional regulator, partial [Beijerinckia sp. L45]|uniref:LysR family transcriptional regulator n=1 Tax=Beijerinckia sp. L45 TaxID=1641855 RepID=UPI00131E10DE